MADAGYRPPKVERQKHARRYQAVRPNHLWHLDFVQRYIGKVSTFTLTRFGGDEFAAALPGVGKEEAVAVAESLRVEVVAHAYERNGVRVYPGMSCGVAVFPEDAADAASVFKAADQAMSTVSRLTQRKTCSRRPQGLLVQLWSEDMHDICAAAALVAS
jgi:hypothetical protein